MLPVLEKFKNLKNIPVPPVCTVPPSVSSGTGSVVDPDPYWIRSQELFGSGYVFPIRIRIHTNKYTVGLNHKIEAKGVRFNLRRKFIIQRLKVLLVPIFSNTVALKEIGFLNKIVLL